MGDLDGLAARGQRNRVGNDAAVDVVVNGQLGIVRVAHVAQPQRHLGGIAFKHRPPGGQNQRDRPSATGTSSASSATMRVSSKPFWEYSSTGADTAPAASATR